jgi:hypothetical protein
MTPRRLLAWSTLAAAVAWVIFAAVGLLRHKANLNTASTVAALVFTLALPWAAAEVTRLPPAKPGGRLVGAERNSKGEV